MKSKSGNYYFFIIIICIFFGCSSLVGNIPPDESSKRITEIQKTLKKQKDLIERLQALLADQILKNNELEQAIPPRELLESLQSDFVELKNKIKALEKQISFLKKDVEKFEIKEKRIKTFEGNFSENQMKIISGLISLHAGNPNDAKGHFQGTILKKENTKMKSEILMAIGNSFLSQGHAKQAASHYGIFLREFPKSPRVPQALFFLGMALGELGEERKKNVLWIDLIEKYPNSHFSLRARKILKSNSKSKK